MHPVKSRLSIAQGIPHARIRSFSLDREDELQKIVDETRGAAELP